MRKYYYTSVDSETGVKLSELHNRGIEAQNKAKELAIEMGVGEWRMGGFAFYGGMTSVKFIDKPLICFKKKKDNEYVPNLKTEPGKLWNDRMRKLPIVRNVEVNGILNIDEPWHMPGLTFKYKGFIMIVVYAEWNIKLPSDCFECVVKYFTQDGQEIKG